LGGVVFLTQLHKFNDFLDTVDPFCNCCMNSIETTEHFPLHCSNFSIEQRILFDNLQTLDINKFPLNPTFLCTLLLYSDAKLTNNVNCEILLTLQSVVFVS